MRIPKSMARKIVITAALACFGIGAAAGRADREWHGTGSPRGDRAGQRNLSRPTRRRPSTVPSWTNTALRVTTNARPFRRTDR